MANSWIALAKRTRSIGDSRDLVLVSSRSVRASRSSEGSSERNLEAKAETSAESISSCAVDWTFPAMLSRDSDLSQMVPLCFLVAGLQV